MRQLLLKQRLGIGGDFLNPASGSCIKFSFLGFCAVFGPGAVKFYPGQGITPRGPQVTFLGSDPHCLVSGEERRRKIGMARQS